MHLLGPSLGTGLLGARPSPASRSADLARLLSLSGDLEPEEGVPRVPAMPSAPKLIPRILHQTYKSADVPQSARRLMLSWRTLHPGWDIRFYDDQDCLDFVRREFPEYLAAYRSLERDVQRSDFFRYMVVLRLGGVYADIDTEARQPLDGLLASSDTLVVGWESDFPDAQATVDAWYVRPRQVLQWVFAAAPGHPALRAACDRIAAGVATRHSLSPAIDTLERTGPGLFTDVVLEAAAGSPWAGAARDPWTVRILPRVAFGAPKAPAHGLTPLDPGVVVLHHFMGSWRSRRRWPWQVSAGEVARALARRFLARPGDAEAAEVRKLEAADRGAEQLYPTSLTFDPPYVALAPRRGLGESQSGADVAAALAAHGSWQPSVQPLRGPTLAEALVGSLGGAGQRRGTLVDVGAGYGVVALAAAARGHAVHAFEAGPGSAAALRASLAYNGFGDRVALHETEVLGAVVQSARLCLDVPAAGGEAGGATGAPPLGEAAVELARGYGPPEAYRAREEPGECRRPARRTTLAQALPAGLSVDALRISANGWEAHILEGFAPLLAAAPPPVIALEWNPAALRRAGTPDPVAAILRPLLDAGYTEASHSGYVCDERWYAATYGVRRRGGVTPEELAALRQPTWCRLHVEDWGALLERASPRSPETLLFVNREAGAARRRMGGGAGDAAARAGHAEAAGGDQGASDAEPGALTRAALGAAAANAGGAEAVAAAGHGSRAAVESVGGDTAANADAAAATGTAHDAQATMETADGAKAAASPSPAVGTQPAAAGAARADAATATQGRVRSATGATNSLGGAAELENMDAAVHATAAAVADLADAQVALHSGGDATR
ncbi:hypothetical protein ACKKBF_B34135 [Auxenochlorella protothecoides x Auxenochlorella symbiontica]